jgi:hypothetical protein
MNLPFPDSLSSVINQLFGPGLSQHARLITLASAQEAGLPESLVVERFHGQESVNDNFQFDIDALSVSTDLDLKQFIGTELTLRLLQADGSRRAWHGYCTQASWLGADGGLARYRLRLESFLDIRLNREELRKKWGIDTPNVSEAEKSLFAEFRQAKTEQAAARQQLAKAAKASKNHPDNSAALEALTTARELAAKADVRLNLAEAAWNEERNKNEPSKVRAFRKSLMKSPAVSQIFDPWFMDSNSKDKNAPFANLQISRNEKTHAHHFHITVLEPKIL